MIIKLRSFSLFVVVTFGISLQLASAAEPERKPAVGVGTKPAAGTEKKPGETAEITDFAQVFTGIPREVMQELRRGSRGFEEAATKATEEVRKNVQKKSSESDTPRG